MSELPSNLEFSMQGNQLCIGRHGSLTHRIRLWPRPLAQEWSDRFCRWERFFPEFRVVSYPLPPQKTKAKDENQLLLGLDVAESYLPGKLTKRRAYDLLRQTLPLSYGIALAPFKGHQWSMIVYLWKYRRFYELLKGNPVMAFALANYREVNWAIYMKNLSLEKMTGMKQTRLLELLDLPGSKNIVQLFRKIHPSSAQLNLLDQIRCCLQEEGTIKQLSHLRKINAGVLHLLTSEEAVRSKVTPQLLDEISRNRQNNHYPIAAHAMRECVQWHGQIRGTRRFPNIRTMDALTAYHEELAAEVEYILEAQRRQQAAEERERVTERARQEAAERSLSLEEAMKKQFPKPPIKGTSSIIPLRTWGDLIEEGQWQHNCVSQYSERVHKGGCYIYRVMEPERATLSIVKSSGSQWIVSELKAKFNAAVGTATRQAVERWLGSYQLGI